MPTVHSVPLPPPAPQTGVRMTCWVHIKHLLDKGGGKGYKKLFGGNDAARKEMKEDLKFMAYLAVPYRFLKAEVFKLFESKFMINCLPPPEVLFSVIIRPIHTRIGRMRTARSIDLNLLFRLLLKGQK